MNTLKLLTIFIVATLPSLALAHAGHDHSAAESGLIHLLWLLPAIAAALIGYRTLVTNKGVTNKAVSTNATINANINSNNGNKELNKLANK